MLHLLWTQSWPGSIMKFRAIKIDQPYSNVLLVLFRDWPIPIVGTTSYVVRFAVYSQSMAVSASVFTTAFTLPSSVHHLVALCTAGYARNKARTGRVPILRGVCIRDRPISRFRRPFSVPDPEGNAPRVSPPPPGTAGTHVSDVICQSGSLEIRPLVGTTLPGGDSQRGARVSA